MPYSQNLEEQYILDYFNGQTGTFLDVGSNDGVTLSNTFALAKLGWKGVLVEPSPKAFQKLKENYQGMEGFYFYPFALGTTNKKVEMWDSGTHLNKDDHGLLSTMSEVDYNKWKGSTEFTKIEVKCFRWKTFLNRLSVKHFDFITIDCEGEDLAILKQINLTDTKMVCVEWNGKDRILFENVCYGFRLIHQNAENLIFAR